MDSVTVSESETGFQSTHPRGVRPGTTKVLIKDRSFNPRTHEGCDTTNEFAARKLGVSIHAPTRGATVWDNVRFDTYDVSIHAPTRGATHITFATSTGQKFQSTHPRGVRPYRAADGLHSRSFNPRTHEGCDYIRRL